ncbi:MAG: YihY/virulence factor BrkB family protein [Nitrososphaerales archaeon]
MKAQGASTQAPGGGRHWKATLEEIRAHLRRDRVSVSAGSLAYHGFLAFFPAVIAALGVLTLVHVGSGTLHHLVHGIMRALPAGASTVFKGAVSAAAKRRTGSIVAVVFGVVVALWSATSAAAVLQQVLDVAYEVPVDRKFMARRVRGLPLLVLTGVLGGLAAVLIVFGEPIGAAIGGSFPVGGAAFVVGWTAFRWIVAFALVSVLFSAYYAFGPNRGGLHWRFATPGSLLATAVFLAGSLGFSFYVSTFGSYGKTYGSFAGVAIFIFWMYLTSLAVLIGGELNAQLERESMLAASQGIARAPAGAGPEPGADAEPGTDQLSEEGRRVAG